MEKESRFNYTESYMFEDNQQSGLSLNTVSSTTQNILSSQIIQTTKMIEDPEKPFEVNLQQYKDLQQKYNSLQQEHKTLSQKYDKLQSLYNNLIQQRRYYYSNQRLRSSYIQEKKERERYQKKFKDMQQMFLSQQLLRQQCQKQADTLSQQTLSLQKELQDSSHKVKTCSFQLRNHKYVNEQIKEFAQLGIMLQMISIMAKDEFQLQTKNLQSIAEKCLKLYRINHKYSQIVIFCFYKHFWKRILHQGTDWSMQKIQQSIGQKMKILQQKFPPFHKNGIKEVKDINYIQIKQQKQINLFLKGQFMNQDDIFKEFARIKQQSIKAKKHLKRLLKQMINHVGDKTNSFDIGLKIPQHQTNKYKAYLRLIQKIFKKDLTKLRGDIFRDVELSLSKHSGEQRNSIIADSFNSIWKKYIERIISQKRKNKQRIQCHVYDFLRCKCCFKDEKQLRQGFNFFHDKCSKQIFSIENKLKQKTKSIVIKLIITEKQEQTLCQPIVAEIQLLLEHDKDANQFNHSIFEMGRSPLGYLFGVILVLSQNTCTKSFQFCIKDVKSHFDKFLKIVEGWETMPSSKIYIENELKKMQK